MTEDMLGSLERQVGRLLFGGVTSAAICLTAGLVLWMMGDYPAAANRVLTAGLVLLMITPIARVVISFVVYVRMRDWFFVGTTIMVFVVLLLAWLVKTKP